jgi:hypothetical protein
MNAQFTVVETIKLNRKTVKLIQDADGFWGWVIGRTTKLPVFFYRGTALISARHYVAL